MSLNLKNKNLLYVEYMELTKKENSELFKTIFNNIYFCNNGLDALEIFKKQQIDCVITDICLPKLDGLTLSKKIRALNAGVPIIIHSLNTSEKDFISAIEYSVNSFVIKEKSTTKLLKAIQNIYLKNNMTEMIELNNNLSWSINSKQLFKDHVNVKLTKNESRLLELLISNDISTSEVIQDFLYDDSTYNNKRVNNLVSRLNLKLKTKLVESIYGFGYKIKSKFVS